MKQIMEKPIIIMIVMMAVVVLPFLLGVIDVVAPETPYDITGDYIETTNSAGTYSASMLIALDEDGIIYGLDTTDGSENWTHTPATGTAKSMTATTDGVWISVDDTTDRFDLLSYTDGTVQDTFTASRTCWEMETVDNTQLLCVDLTGTDELYSIDVVGETETLLSSNVVATAGTGTHISGDYSTFIDGARNTVEIWRHDDTTDGYTGAYDLDTINANFTGTESHPYLDKANNKLYVAETDGDFMKLSLTGSNTATSDWDSTTAHSIQAVVIATDGDIVLSNTGDLVRYPNADLDGATADYTTSHTGNNSYNTAIAFSEETQILYRGDNTGRVGAFDISDGSTDWEVDINVGTVDISHVVYAPAIVDTTEFTTSHEFAGEDGVVYLEHATTGTAKYYQVCYTHTFDGITNDLELEITDDLDTDNELDYPITTTENVYVCTDGIEFGAWDKAIINVDFTDDTDTFVISNVAVVNRCVGEVCSPSTQEVYEDYYTIETTNMTQYRTLFEALPIMAVAGIIVILIVISFKTSKE